MGKKASLVTSKEDRISDAREHILAAASILRGLGGTLDRVSWFLEDAITFLEDVHDADDGFVQDVFGATDAEFVPAPEELKIVRTGTKVH